jgi:TonB dependent receptor/Tetratricopeptide repeat
MVLGFAALTRIDIDQAKAVFERAIALDSANPLPRLGLGLARIRESDLEEGRQEIEVAAALDPNDALIRSYLGKAYFEEKRDDLAGEQYAIAKELDPNDPTPYFYDAIRLQLDNRPVEALRNLERSIKLNNNRAVYRSRLLLDEDTATRGVSLARIYDDLGFDQRALVEATKSLSEDPGNWSAHRFLSDTYARLPRHEIARVSELLQSQLLQPININPVQPSLPFTDLSVVAGAGPAEAAFNEFTPLFTRNSAQLITSGVVGNNDTYGGEGVLSMLYDRTSVSVGGSAFDTDGFRDNNDVKNRLAGVFAQTAVTPKLSLQAEYRKRVTDQGDLELRFDPRNFSPGFRRDLNQDTGRVGLRYELTSSSDLITSLIVTDRDEDLLDVTEVDTPIGPIESRSRTELEDEGYQIEGQYLFQSKYFDVVAGLGGYDVDVDRTVSRSAKFPDGSIVAGTGSETTFRREQAGGYVYNDIKYPEDVVLTLGLGYTSFEQSAISVEKFIPKIGLRWLPVDDVQLRAVAMRTVKRALVADQTIEPTQVAGFNQFFDDINGTVADRYGLGVDLRLSPTLYLGGELNHRDLDIPVEVRADGNVDSISDEGDEELWLAYAYWAFSPNWAVSAELLVDKFEGGEELGPDTPRRIDTLTVPVALRYFHDSGLFAEVGARFLDQEIRRDTASGRRDENEQTVLFDAAAGYRLPGRRGIFSLEVVNIADEEFKFQDDNFRTSETRSARFVPDRTVLARLTLNF